MVARAMQAFALGAAVLVHEANAQAVRTQTTVVSTAKSGYTTYQVSVTFDSGVQDVYALYGEPSDGPSISRELIIPPAYQVATPFGSDVGPVNPAFFAVMPDCEFDSFLTIGMEGPSLVPGALSTIGVDFASWTESAGIRTTDGAVFFMDPEHGATAEPVVFAQLTVRTGTHFTGQINAQGRSSNGAHDWDVVGLQFSDTAIGASPAPAPPTRDRDCPNLFDPEKGMLDFTDDLSPGSIATLTCSPYPAECIHCVTHSCEDGQIEVVADASTATATIPVGCPRCRCQADPRGTIASSRPRYFMPNMPPLQCQGGVWTTASGSRNTAYDFEQAPIACRGHRKPPKWPLTLLQQYI